MTTPCRIRVTRAFTMAAASVAFFATSAFADSHTWTNEQQDGNFNESNNWDTYAFPGTDPADEIIIDLDDTTLNVATLSSAELTFSTLTVGKGTLIITSDASATIIASVSGTGAILDDGGAESNLILDGGTLNYGTGNDDGVFNWTGNISLTNGAQLIRKGDGADGTNTFVNSGVITMKNSSWTIPKTTQFGVGAGNKVTLDMENSELWIGNRTYFGNGVGTEFEATLTDSHIYGHWYFRIGERSTAKITLNGASSITQGSSGNDYLVIGSGRDANTTITLNGTSFIKSLDRDIMVSGNVEGQGNGAKGTLIMNDSSKLFMPAGGNLYLGRSYRYNNDGSSGILRMSGQSNINVHNRLVVGGDSWEHDNIENKQLTDTIGEVYMKDEARMDLGNWLLIGDHFRNGYVEMRDKSFVSIPTETVMVGNRGGRGELRMYNEAKILSGSEFFIGRSHDNQPENNQRGFAYGLVSMYDNSTVTIARELQIGRDRASDMDNKNTLNMYDESNITINNGSIWIGCDNAVGVINMLNRYDDEGNLISENNSFIKDDAVGAVLGMAYHWDEWNYGELNMEGNAQIDSWRGWIAANGGHNGEAIINMRGNSRLTFNSTTNGKDQSVRVGSDARNIRATINLSGNALFECKADMWVTSEGGSEAYGTINISENATLSIANNMVLAVSTDNSSYGTINISGNGTLIIGNEFPVAHRNAGHGIVNIDGGLLSVGQPVVMAHYSTENGEAVINVRGGKFLAPRIVVGQHFSNNSAGRREVNVSGGLVEIPQIFVGSRGSNGTLNIAGGEVKATSLYIGHSDHGGAVDFAGGNLIMGDENNSAAVGVINTTEFIVGHYNAQGHAWINEHSIINAENVYIGRDGYAEITFTDNATMDVTGTFFIGGGDGAMDGTITLPDWSPNDAAHSGKASSGIAGKGILLIKDDAQILATDSVIVLSKQYSFENGTDEDGETIIAKRGEGHLLMDGGVIVAQGIVKGTAGAVAEARINGGTITLTEGGTLFEGFTKGEVTLGENGATIHTEGNDVAINAGLTGTGNLVKNGTGDLAISGDNSDWTGALNVNAGTVSIEDGATVTFVLNCQNAPVNGTVNAQNIYTGGGDILVHDVTLNVVLANVEDLAVGEYTFDVFPGATVTGTVSVGSAPDGYWLIYENGKIKLTVTEGTEPPESGFANWAGGEFNEAELADPAISGPEADPQNIGVPNLLRYALGLGRNESPVGALPTLTKNGTAGGLGALSAGDSYTFSYPCDLTKTDIEYIVETSEDLKNWSKIGEIPTVENGTASVTISADGAVRKFFRLKIVQK